MVSGGGWRTCCGLSGVNSDLRLVVVSPKRLPTLPALAATVSLRYRPTAAAYRTAPITRKTVGKWGRRRGGVLSTRE
jgi:hypothetical protein